MGGNGQSERAAAGGGRRQRQWGWQTLSVAGAVDQPRYIAATGWSRRREAGSRRGAVPARESAAAVRQRLVACTCSSAPAGRTQRRAPAACQPHAPGRATSCRGWPSHKRAARDPACARAAGLCWQSTGRRAWAKHDAAGDSCRGLGSSAPPPPLTASLGSSPCIVERFCRSHTSSRSESGSSQQPELFATVRSNHRLPGASWK